NVFQLSPYQLVASNFQQNPTGPTEAFAMAGGGAYYQVDTLGTGDIKKGQTQITGVNQAAIDRLAVGMVTNNVDVFGAGTAITKLGDNTIDLSAPAGADWAVGRSFTFVGS